MPGEVVSVEMLCRCLPRGPDLLSMPNVPDSDACFLTCAEEMNGLVSRGPLECESPLPGLCSR